MLIAGGVESMIRAPFVLKAQTPLNRAQKLEDRTLGWRFVDPKMREASGVGSMPEKIISACAPT